MGSSDTVSLESLIEAAEQGDFAAQYDLAWFYMHEEEYLDKDQALMWISKAAETGDFDASYFRADILEQLDQKSAAAEQLADLAERGFSPAIYVLSRKYKIGGGVEKNLQRATELLETAAAYGHILARKELLVSKWRSSKSIWEKAWIRVQICCLAIYTTFLYAKNDRDPRVYEMDQMVKKEFERLESDNG